MCLVNYSKINLYFLFLSFVDESNAYIWLLKGMSEQNMHRYEDALQSYLTSVTVNPSILLSCIKMIDTLLLSDKMDEARQVYSILQAEVDPSEYLSDPFYVEKCKKIEASLKMAA
jgi:tetratricopeptide (TPR) repeat protein